MYDFAFNLSVSFCLQVNRFARCDVCTVLKEEKQKTMDKELRSYLDNLLLFHNDIQT